MGKGKTTGGPAASPAYAKGALELVTVAAEFCAYLEQSEGRRRREFVDTLLKLLPLLYLKIQTLDRVESLGDFLPRARVTEEDYDFVRSVARGVMGDRDDYEDTADPDEDQTEERRWKTASEGLADMYQPLRDFVSAYQLGVEDCMRDALWSVRESFELGWGRALVDTLRHLHRVAYTINTAYDEEDIEPF